MTSPKLLKNYHSSKNKNLKNLKFSLDSAQFHVNINTFEKKNGGGSAPHQKNNNFEFFSKNVRTNLNKKKFHFFFKSVQINMKDAVSVDSKEKSNFRFFRFLFFEL